MNNNAHDVVQKIAQDAATTSPPAKFVGVDQVSVKNLPYTQIGAGSPDIYVTYRGSGNDTRRIRTS